MLMKVAKGDVVRLHYIGRVKETGEIFDTTYEEVAKEAGIYSEKGIYGPVPIAIGAGHVLKGLDEKLEGLEVGKKYTIEIPPEKAFGKRDARLIKTFTLGQFRRQGIVPFPGLEVEIETEDGKKLKGKVLSVSSGRVRVDFNHPLAGKTVVYDVEIVEKIEDPIEKVKALIELRLPMVDLSKVKIEVGEKDVKVDFRDVEIDRNTFILGKIILESDLRFIGYEQVEFRPTIDELLKPLEVKVEEETEKEVKEGTTEKSREEEVEEKVEEVKEENKLTESAEKEKAGETKAEEEKAEEEAKEEAKE
ncbi:MAG TPA: peptidylprolyl isomerase [Thermococcus paralvinellae]|uniref:Peptidyl-prolyl cis-trans isomerase n=1 Tax=Thermococcus paralvinellae TaxID=582419 RepID=A0A832ZHL7_9EURY|nr:peptidylprolyl isomerase [Thermococcus paralvinellae]